MGSVLGPIFSNFYMSDLENRIFNSTKKPPIYLRYVDDILILTNNINEINILQDTFQNNSVLNLTHEVNKNNKISFLDVLIDANNNNNFTTSTYTCGCPRGVMVKAMNCGIVVREFVLQSRYYVHKFVLQSRYYVHKGKYPWERYEPHYSPSSYG